MLAGSGGGFRLLYSGADTSGFQTVGGSNLFSASGAPTAANLYNGAAIVTNGSLRPNGTIAAAQPSPARFHVFDGARSVIARRAAG